MQIKIVDTSPNTKLASYEKIGLLIAGLVFTFMGLLFLITNIPKAFNSDKISYTYHSYSDSTDSNFDSSQPDKTWQQSFPVYSGLIWPPAFIIGGLLCLIYCFSDNKKLKNFMAGLFTLCLGLMLSYFFQFNFPIVLIPLVFVVIGLFIIWHDVIKK